MNMILRCILSLWLTAFSVKTHGQILLPVTDGQHWGYISRTGKLVVPLQFDRVGMMRGQTATAFRNDSLFFVDQSGNIQSRGQCEQYIALDSRRGISKNKGKWALTDSQGLPLTPFHFDQIFAADTSTHDYIFSINGQSGLMDIYGNTLFGPVESAIRPAQGGLYLLLKGSKTTVVNRHGISPVQETVRSLRHLMGGYFQAVGNRQTLFFHRDSGLILAEKALTFEILNDCFIGVNGSKTGLFNIATGTWCDSFSGPFNPTVDNLLLVTYRGFRHILHPLRGIISDYMTDEVDRFGDHYIIKFRGLQALADTQLRLLTAITYPSIESSHENYFTFRDASGKFALYHKRQQNFITPFRFNNLVVNSSSVKGYLPGNKLLLLDFDSNGMFTDSLLFNQVVSVTVTERAEDRDADNDLNTVLNPRNGITGIRNGAGWFWSPDRNRAMPAGSGNYGLKVKRPGSDTLFTAFKPIFRLIFPLPGGITIAGTYTTLKAPLIPVVNWDRNWEWNATRVMLIHDSLARIMGRIWNYIDPSDFTGHASDYRALGNGQFHLLSTSGHKVLFKAGYISPREGSVRRICKGGKLTTELPEPYRYPAVTDPFLNYTGYIRSRFPLRNIWFVQGEWAILTPDLKVVKPAGARQQKVVYIEPFREGKARYFLEDGTCGVCDSAGGDVIPAIFNEIRELRDSSTVYMAYKYNQNKGILKQNGQTLVDPVYNNIRELGEVYELRKGRETFLADTQGHIITLPPGSTLTEFNGGWGFIRLKARYRIMNVQGDIRESFSCSRVRPYRNGVAQAFFDSRWHLIDTTGNVLARLPYEDALGVTSQSAVFRQRNVVVITDHKGHPIARIRRTDKIEFPAPGIISALQGQRYLLYNETGQRLTKSPLRSKPVMTAGGLAGMTADELHFFDSSGIIRKFRNAKTLKKEDLLEGRAKIVRNRSGFSEIIFHPGQIYAATGDTNISRRVATSIPPRVRLINRHMVQAVQNDLFLGSSSMEKGYYSSHGELVIPAIAYNGGGFGGHVAIAKTEAGFGILGPSGDWLQMPGIKKIVKTPSGRFITTAGYEADLFDAGGKKLNNLPIAYMQKNNGDFRIVCGNRNGWFNARYGIIWLK